MFEPELLGAPARRVVIELEVPRHTGRRICVLGGHEGMTGSL